jgi:hypothetical protein
MASKKKSKKPTPSFDVPDPVKRAEQSGWVYRSDVPPAVTRARKSLRVVEPEIIDVAPVGAIQAVAAPLPVPATNGSALRTFFNPGPMLFLGFGLMAMPFTVPIFVGLALVARLTRR